MLRMNGVLQRIEEYVATKENMQVFAASFLETALYIEDEFGIVLTDEEITPEYLAEPASVVLLVMEKLKCAESAES